MPSPCGPAARPFFLGAILGQFTSAGVWLIVVVLSVMNGFEETWRQEILGNRAHFVIEKEGGVFDGQTTSPRRGETMRRYWIETAREVSP